MIKTEETCDKCGKIKVEKSGITNWISFYIYKDDCRYQCDLCDDCLWELMGEYCRPMK